MAVARYNLSLLLSRKQSDKTIAAVSQEAKSASMDELFLPTIFNDQVVVADDIVQWPFACLLRNSDLDEQPLATVAWYALFTGRHPQATVQDLIMKKAAQDRVFSAALVALVRDVLTKKPGGSAMLEAFLLYMPMLVYHYANSTGDQMPHLAACKAIMGAASTRLRRATEAREPFSEMRDWLNTINHQYGRDWMMYHSIPFIHVAADAASAEALTWCVETAAMPVNLCTRSPGSEGGRGGHRTRDVLPLDLFLETQSSIGNSTACMAVFKKHGGIALSQMHTDDAPDLMQFYMQLQGEAETCAPIHMAPPITELRLRMPVDLGSATRLASREWLTLALRNAVGESLPEDIVHSITSLLVTRPAPTTPVFDVRINPQTLTHIEQLHITAIAIAAAAVPVPVQTPASPEWIANYVANVLAADTAAFAHALTHINHTQIANRTPTLALLDFASATRDSGLLAHVLRALITLRGHLRCGVVCEPSYRFLIQNVVGRMWSAKPVALFLVYWGDKLLTQPESVQEELVRAVLEQIHEKSFPAVDALATVVPDMVRRVARSDDSQFYRRMGDMRTAACLHRLVSTDVLSGDGVWHALMDKWKPFHPLQALVHKPLYTVEVAADETLLFHPVHPPRGVWRVDASLEFARTCPAVYGEYISSIQKYRDAWMRHMFALFRAHTRENDLLGALMDYLYPTFGDAPDWPLFLACIALNADAVDWLRRHDKKWLAPSREQCEHTAKNATAWVPEMLAEGVVCAYHRPEQEELVRKLADEFLHHDVLFKISLVRKKAQQPLLGYTAAAEDVSEVAFV